MPPEAKPQKSVPISEKDQIRNQLLTEAREIGTLLNANSGKNTVFVPGIGNQEPFELPRLPFEVKRHTIWMRLKGEFAFTDQAAYEAVGMQEKVTKAAPSV